MKLCWIVAMWVAVVALSPDILLMAAESSKGDLVFVGTYTGQKSKGIYSARFDRSAGKLSDLKLAAESRNPTFLAISPDGHFLYAVNEVGDFGGKQSGAVSSFSIERESGELRLINQVPSKGSGPCHVSVIPNGKCVLVANYGSGSVAAFRVDSTGGLMEPGFQVQHQGSSVNRQRQEGPHAHFITPSADGNLVLSCDLGLDQVQIYRLDSSRPELALKTSAAITSGAGPRHLAFHPDHPWVYVLNELNSTITICDWHSAQGLLKPAKTLSTLAPDFNGNNSCAEIAVHPSGKWVFSSNRGENTIAVFSVDTRTGQLKNAGRQSTRGKTPRHFALDPSGRWLIAENQDSNDIFVFRFDEASGKLEPVEGRLEIGAPVCLVFAR